MTEKRFLIYDQMKIAALLAVVLGHCLNMYGEFAAIPVVVGSRLFAAGAVILNLFHIPCFFLVSGALFAIGVRKGKYQQWTGFLGQKIRRLMIPYLIFINFAVWPTLAICGLLPSPWYRFFINIITADQSRHMWYLYCLFGVFCLLFPLRRILMEKNPILLLLISFLVSVAVSSSGWILFAYFQLGNVFYYQFFFLCGVLAERYSQRVFAFLLDHRFLFFPALLLLPCGLFFRFSVLTGYVYALAGIVVLFYFASLAVKSDRWTTSAVERLLAKDIYGVYLFHAMIIYLIFYAFREIAVSPPLLVALAFFGSFLPALLLTELCRKARLAFVIGEKNKS